MLHCNSLLTLDMCEWMFFRDDIMIKAMERRFDKHAAQLMKELLRLMYLRTDTWAAESNPVPIMEIRDAINKNLDNNYLSSYIDQYLKIMGKCVCLHILFA